MPPTCPECEKALKRGRCPECGWKSPLAESPPKRAHDRCQWLAAYGRCHLLGAVRIDGVGSYCDWHGRCRVVGYNGTDYQEFETFCLECYRDASYFHELDFGELWDAAQGKAPAFKPARKAWQQDPSRITPPIEREKCLGVIRKVLLGLPVEEGQKEIAAILHPEVPF